LDKRKNKKKVQVQKDVVTKTQSTKLNKRKTFEKEMDMIRRSKRENPFLTQILL